MDAIEFGERWDGFRNIRRVRQAGVEIEIWIVVQDSAGEEQASDDAGL